MTAPTPYKPPAGHIICLRGDVPAGWLYRYNTQRPWSESLGTTIHPAVVVEARPARQPDPKWLWAEGADYQQGASAKWENDGRVHGVTTVGEMRDRTDLNQWEWASTDQGTWFPLYSNSLLFAECADDFPVVVRRVS